MRNGALKVLSYMLWEVYDNVQLGLTLRFPVKVVEICDNTCSASKMIYWNWREFIEFRWCSCPYELDLISTLNVSAGFVKRGTDLIPNYALQKWYIRLKRPQLFTIACIQKLMKTFIFCSRFWRNWEHSVLVPSHATNQAHSGKNYFYHVGTLLLNKMNGIPQEIPI